MNNEQTPEMAEITQSLEEIQAELDADAVEIFPGAPSRRAVSTPNSASEEIDRSAYDDADNEPVAFVGGEVEPEIVAAETILTHLTFPSGLVEAAVYFTERGFGLFPVQNKVPLTRNGFKDATKSPQQIVAMLQRHEGKEGLGLGLSCGESNLFVLDVDVKITKAHPQGTPGMASLAALEAKFEKLPKTWMSRTASGGLHYWFRGHGRNSASSPALGEGLDTRGDGGYIVVPPSVNDKGEGYEWINSPDTTPLADAPQWLIDLVAKREPSTPGMIIPTATQPSEEKVSTGRNNYLTSYAGLRRSQGLSGNELLAVVVIKNQEICDPPLEDEEIQNIVKSVLRYPVDEERIARDKKKEASLKNAQKFAEAQENYRLQCEASRKGESNVNTNDGNSSTLGTVQTNAPRDGQEPVWDSEAEPNDTSASQTASGDTGSTSSGSGESSTSRNECLRSFGEEEALKLAEELTTEFLETYKKEKDATALYKPVYLWVMAYVYRYSQLEFKKICEQLKAGMKTAFPKRAWTTEVQEMLKELPKEASATPTTIDGKPVILVDRDVDVVGDALLVFLKTQEFYKRKDVVCRIRPLWTMEDGDLETFDNHTLASYLYTQLRFRKQGKDDLLIGRVDTTQTDYVKHDHNKVLLPLKGVSSIPIVAPTGKIIVEPGYDHETAMYYKPESERYTKLSFTKSFQHLLTQKLARRKLNWFYQTYLREFPWADAASKTNMLGLVLTGLCRPAIPGCIPLFLFDANKQGSGKTLLASVEWCVVYGRKIQVKTLPTDNSEMRKMITAMLMGGQPIVTFDNVTSKVFDPNFTAALTAETWTDRILGGNEIATLPQRTIWTLTGNDLRIGDENIRRCVMIRLETMEEHPELQTHSITHLEATLLEDRPRILQNLLGVVKAYYDVPEDDRPQGQTKGSFQSWASIIGGMLEYAGYNDLMGNFTTGHFVNAETQYLTC